MLPKSPENDPVSLDSIRDVLKQAASHLQGEQPKPLEALKLFEEVIDALQGRDNSKDEAARHLLATTWMQKATILLSSPDKTKRQEIQKAFQASIKNFESIPVKNNQQYLSDCVALWTTIAQSQLQTNNAASIEGAIGCFEKALSFINMLPWQENLQLRSHLISLWSNIGIAHTRINGAMRRTAALNAFSHAIVFSQDFPVENPQAALLISNIWLNRGALFANSSEENHLKEAAFSFEKSIAILQKAKPADDPNIALALGRSHAHRALILSASQEQAEINASSIEADAEKAISCSEALLDQSPIAAEITLNARLGLGRNLLNRLQKANGDDALALYERATDEVDEAMSLIRKCEDKGYKAFRHFARNFFRVGTRLYQVRQPHFLAEFIEESIGEGQSLREDAEMVEVARTCIQETIAAITKNNPVVVGSPESEQVLAIVNPLKAILDALPAKAEDAK